TLTPKVGDGVFGQLVNEALARTEAKLGLTDRGPKATASTTMGTHKTFGIDRAVDGDDGTYFWSSGAPKVGDEVRIDYGSPISVGRVTLRQGQADDTSGDMISNGVLESSTDGTTWTEIGQVEGRTLVEITLDEPVAARYLRVRATAVNKPSTWVQVREFSASVLPSGVTSTIPATAGTSPGSVADRSLDTRFTASRVAGDDDRLTWEFEARSVDQLTLVGDVSGTVQVRRGDRWVDVGTVDDRFASRVEVGGDAVDAVRVIFAEGSTPDIAEVIPG
ncbi:MAG: discoidin domain-containing protein, partial [Propionibacteriales bacterium]|nr:discoidin domain-containing protein [Propionibacteriales bacterium]